VIADPRSRGPILDVLRQANLGCQEFDDVEDLIARAPKQAPSVLLLWAHDSSSELAGKVVALTQRFLSSPVIVVRPGVKRWDVRAALSAGASGVLAADNLATGLYSCIYAALSGQVCVPREHWQQIEPPALSTREKQILGLVVMGYMNSQIAERLFLAESTIKSHLSSAFGKLGVRSRNEAVKLIIDPERGLGMGILALGGERVESTSTTNH
jgi:DNA-binding NarL/FixJ family response regulator